MKNRFKIAAAAAFVIAPLGAVAIASSAGAVPVRPDNHTSCNWYPVLNIDGGTYTEAYCLGGTDHYVAVQKCVAGGSYTYQFGPRQGAPNRSFTPECWAGVSGSGIAFVS